MADAPDLVRVFLTHDPLLAGEVPEVMAEIHDGVAIFGDCRYRVAPEGRAWHRTRWAAENYARQLQQVRIGELRAELARLEGMRFGRPGR